jgi:two-component system, chemotaxis family, sensor kinase CheA
MTDPAFSSDCSREETPDTPAEDAETGRRDPLDGIVDDPGGVDEKYLTIFADETEANLREFVELLLRSPEERDAEQVVQLMHKAHQIKGGAAVVGCSRVAAVAHAVEDLLQKRMNRSLLLTEAMVESLLECSDETAGFLERLRRGEFGFSEDGFSRVVRRLLEAEEEESKTREEPEQPEEADETAVEWKSRVADALQPGLKGYVGRVVFREGLQLSNYKAQLIHEKLLNLSDVVCFQPDPRALEHLDRVTEVRFGVVSDVSAEEVAACLRVAGVLDSAVEPVEPAEPAGENRAVPPNPSPRKETSGAKVSQTLRVETRQLDHLMSLAGQLIVNRAKLARSAASIRTAHGSSEEFRGLEEALDELTYISDNIRKAVTDTRMVPIDPLFSMFRRVLRDAGDASGKKIRLEMLGAETRLDKRLIDELGDPLIHLVRNAIDHGIETPDERERAGKNCEGTLWLEAFQEGHDVVVRVRDDGRGLDVDAIRRRAIERDFLGEQEAETLDDPEIVDFIWRPGFSTARRVTKISGRGVGMDIVRSTIERLGGTIEVESTPGEGCAFTIRLPLTLAIASGLLMETGGEIHAVPTKSVVEVLRVSPDQVRAVGGLRVLGYRGNPLSVVGIDEFLGLPSSSNKNGHFTVVVVRQFEHRIGLLVDRVVGEQDLVIQSIVRNYGPVPEVAGVGVLGDGRLTLILDVGSLFSRRSGGGPRRPLSKPAASVPLVHFQEDVDRNEELEILRRVFVAGTVESSAVMSRWTGQKIELTVDRIQRLPLEIAVREMELDDDIMTMIVLAFEGAVGATFVLMFDDRSGKCLAASLARIEPDFDSPWSELEKSALMETGNILACAYVNVMTEMLQTPVQLSEPFFVQDYGASVFQQAVLEQAADADHVVICETGFRCADKPVAWRSILIPDRRFENALLELPRKG